MTGTISIGTIASYAALAASAYSIYSTATAEGPQAPQAPQAPDYSALKPPTLNDATGAAASLDAEKRRRVSATRALLNPTGGLGDTSSPGIAAKTLLGA
jgi:hypothetical protein